MDTTIASKSTDKQAVKRVAYADPPALRPRADALRLSAIVLSVLTIILTLRYVVWRFTVTEWRLWWLSLPLLAAELFTAMHILGYQYTIWPRKPSKLRPVDDVSNLPIYVFIPTVNEPDNVLRLTIVGAKAARDKFLKLHPDASVRIIVCNDAYVANVRNWQSVETLAASKGVECVTRKVHGGAKAGNIEFARRYVNAIGNCLLTVLDADQVAEPDFLCRTVAMFADPEVGWVQTRQFYRNTDVLVSRWAESQASVFYDLVCPGKSGLNASYICGTNVVIRASVLDQIGGFPTESVTEDFAASIRTHQTWRSVYIKDVLVRGLGPLDLSGYFVQQARWARGTIGVLRSDWKRLLLPSRGGLSFSQRVQYFLSGTHYLCGMRDLIFLSTALISLSLSISPIKHVSLATICWYLLPYVFASQALLMLQAGSSSVISGMVIGYISFPTLVLSFIEAAVNRKMRFRVTPKSASSKGDLRAIVPHALIAAVCIAALVHAIATRTAFTTTDLIPMLWVTYALCIVTPAFFLARLKPGGG